MQQWRAVCVVEPRRFRRASVAPVRLDEEAVDAVGLAVRWTTRRTCTWCGPPPPCDPGRTVVFRCSSLRAMQHYVPPGARQRASAETPKARPSSSSSSRKKRPPKAAAAARQRRCLDCGQDRRAGRADGTSGDWYCDDCWAAFDGESSAAATALPKAPQSKNRSAGDGRSALVGEVSRAREVEHPVGAAAAGAVPLQGRFQQWLRGSVLVTAGVDVSAIDTYVTCVLALLEMAEPAEVEAEPAVRALNACCSSCALRNRVPVRESMRPLHAQARR